MTPGNRVSELVADGEAAHPDGEGKDAAFEQLFMPAVVDPSTSAAMRSSMVKLLPCGWMADATSTPSGDRAPRSSPLMYWPSPTGANLRELR